MNSQSNLYNTIKQGKELSQLLENCQFPIDIKDVKTGKYIDNNLAASTVSGLTPKERIGLDIYDIGRINQLKVNTIEQVVKADKQVDPEKSLVSFTHIFRDKISDTIIVDKVIKKAVLNDSNQMVAILSYAQDIVPYVERPYLYSLYKDYYPAKKAVQTFLKYLNLDSCFITMPTEEELYILLTMEFNGEIEAISQKLGISSKAVKNYQTEINNKLTIMEYDEIVMRLQVPSTYRDFNGSA